MPLDTPITIRLEAIGDRNEHGEYVPGPVTEYPVWADQVNSGSTDQITPNGTFVTEVRTFTVRWFQELANHQTDLITLTVEGNRWDIESVGIGRDRRRALQITASRFIPEPG